MSEREPPIQVFNSEEHGEIEFIDKKCFIPSIKVSISDIVVRSSLEGEEKKALKMEIVKDINLNSQKEENNGDTARRNRINRARS